MLVVFFHHKKIAEYPSTYDHDSYADGTLIISNDGKKVKEYKHGTWHAAGEDIICSGSANDTDPDCKRCNPRKKI